MGVPCLDEGSTPSDSTILKLHKKTLIYHEYVSVFFVFYFKFVVT